MGFLRTRSAASQLQRLYETKAGHTALHACSVVLTVLFVLLGKQARGQEFCQEFITNNQAVVALQTAEELEVRGATFQDLLDCLDDGGSLTFAVHRFNVDVTINVTRSIRLHSAPGLRTALICKNRPIVDIRSGTVELSDLAVKGCRLDEPGKAGKDNAPIIVRSGAQVTLRSVRFANNVNANGTAGIHAEENSTITIFSSRFDRNTGRSTSVLKAGAGCQVEVTGSSFHRNQGRRGVATLVDADRLDISDCNFTENTATQRRGGVLHIKGERQWTTVSIGNGSNFDGNRAEDSDGGAVSVVGNVRLRIESGARFVRNSAAMRGGAIFVLGASDISIDGSSFIGNTADFIGGGAVFVESDEGVPSTILIAATLFSQNVARNYLGSGGGLRVRGANVTCNVSDSTVFALNQAELDGGGMHVSDVDSLSIKTATFVGNEAASGGGAAMTTVSLESFTNNLMHVEILDSRFFLNRAMHGSRGGGTLGMTGVATAATIRNSVFMENNSGEGPGGALYLFNGPSASVTSCTFERNRAHQGGAVYAQEDVREEVKNSLFRNNSAEEGGAFRIRGDVDLTLTECTLTNNEARTDGGAIKSLNYQTSENERSFIVVHNCTVEKNQAGSNLFEDALYGTATVGGAFLLVGNGIDVEIKGSNFTKNKASHGGAIKIEAVAECNIADKNIFKENRANFGGAIFIEVDEDVESKRNQEKYLLNQTQFRRNEAEEGGAVYVGNGRIALGERSFNARRFVIRLLTCLFENNRARRNGGAFTVVGSAVEIRQGTIFRSNRALSTGAAPLNTRGGALRVDNGAVMQIEDSSFENNSANIGGAASVNDASLETNRVTFTANAAKKYQEGGGVGGAIALEVSPEKDIPVLNSQNFLMNVIYEAFQCSFSQNFASLRGGAVHLHHRDPGTNITLGEDCNNNEDLSSCVSRERYLRRLEQRGVILYQSNFTQNMAQAGGALFTNNPRMLNTTAGRIYASEILTEVWVNNTYLEEAGLRFENNSNAVEGYTEGYGTDFATTPVTPLLTTSNQSNNTNRSHLVIGDFYSGDQLNFTIAFEDALGQVVNTPMNFAATIAHVPSSIDEPFDLFGQLTAQMDEDRNMSFKHTWVRGNPGTSYHLRIEYESTDSSLTYVVQASNITIIMRPCQRGNRTIDRAGNVTECESCPIGSFGKYPEQDECVSCTDMEYATCNGNTVVPDKNFWHATSVSLEMYRCVGVESCDFYNRANRIQKAVLKIHASGNTLSYIKDSALLCQTGYRGPLCGSCKQGYGRANLRCLKCGAAGIRYFLLMLVVVWAIAVVSYFIKTVLELPLRTELSRDFQQRLPDLRIRMSGANNAVESRVNRKGNLAKRVSAIVSGRGEDVQLLTIANPVAEVLKIIINFLQISASAISIAVRWTEQVSKLLVALGVVGNVTTEQSFLSLDCFMKSDDKEKAIRRMMIAVLQPVMFLCLFLIFWIVSRVRKKIDTKALKQRLLLTYLAVNYFAYISITESLLRFLACAEISDPDLDETQRGRYWQEDTDVMCYRRKHAVLVGAMVIPLICIVILGFPLGTACILKRNKSKLADEEFTATYGFLYRAYKKSYWEVIIMVRKAAIAAIAVFAQLLGHNLQALLCILVLIAALCLQLAVQPFTQELHQLNGLEAVSLSCSIIIFVVGLMLDDPWMSRTGRIFSTIVIYLVVFGALGVMLKELMLAVEEFLDSKILQEDIMDIAVLLDIGRLQKGRILIDVCVEKLREKISGVFRDIAGRSVDPSGSQRVRLSRKGAMTQLPERRSGFETLPQ